MDNLYVFSTSFRPTQFPIVIFHIVLEPYKFQLKFHRISRFIVLFTSNDSRLHFEVLIRTTLPEQFLRIARKLLRWSPDQEFLLFRRSSPLGRNSKTSPNTFATLSRAAPTKLGLRGWVFSSFLLHFLKSNWYLLNGNMSVMASYAKVGRHNIITTT